MSKRFRIDTEIVQQIFDQIPLYSDGDFPESGCHRNQSACTASGLKLVAFGVATEIVVIVENEDARFWSLFSVEMCGREAADATPHNDKVIYIGVGLFGGPPVAPVPKPELVTDFEGSDVIPAQPGTRRRIDTALHAGTLKCECLLGECRPWNQTACRKRPDPVQEIPARNAAVHSQVTVCRFHGPG